jgi:hypothetical protein
MKKQFRGWRYRQRRMKRTLRDTLIHRMLGERLFDHRIWGLDVPSLASGLSLGLFVAFTPTIPFQMLLCAIGALVLRVNLPIALAACWVTNPVTALPIYLAARQLGQLLLEHTAIADLIISFFSFESKAGVFMEQSLYLWAGSLIFAVFGALLGNLAVRWAARLSHWLKLKVQDHREQHPAPGRSGGRGRDGAKRRPVQ